MFAVLKLIQFSSLNCSYHHSITVSLLINFILLDRGILSLLSWLLSCISIICDCKWRCLYLFNRLHRLYIQLLRLLKLMRITLWLYRMVLLHETRRIRIDVIKTALSLIIFNFININPRITNLYYFIKVC